MHGNRPCAFWISDCSTSHFSISASDNLTNRIESQQVVSVLLTRGRLSLSQIHRYTQLRPRIARASILVLVQHNLLWHAQSEDGMEVFEFNVDECLARLRFGKVVFMAQQLFGKAVSLLQRSFVNDDSSNLSISRVQSLCRLFSTMENCACQIP